MTTRLATLLCLIASSVLQPQQVDARNLSDVPSFNNANAHISARKNFYAAFSSLATQYGLCIVAESEPLHWSNPTDSPNNAPPLNASLDERLKAAASAYDYSMERRGRIVLLKKRYSDPADIPDISLTENLVCQTNLITLLKVMDPDRAADYRSPQTAASGDFVRSLTDDQLALMSKEIQGARVSLSLPSLNALPVSALSPSQRGLCYRVALSHYIHNHLGDILWAPSEAKIPAVNTAAFFHETWIGFDLFGYGLPDKNDVYGTIDRFSDKNFRPLSNPSLISGPGSSFMASFPGETDRTISLAIRMDTSRHPLPAPPDPTEPGDDREARDADEKKRQAALAVANSCKRMTLQEIANAVNAGAARATGEKSSSNESIALAKGIEEKRLTVINGAACSPRDILDAAVDIYGLRIVEPKAGDMTVTYRRVPQPNGITDLAQSVRAILPEPFLRQTANGERFSPEHGLRVRRQPGSFSPPSPYGQAEASRIAAIRRMRSLIEPLLKNKPKSVVLVKDAPVDARMALADALLLEVSELAGSLYRDTPPITLTRFDDLYLVGYVNEKNGHRDLQYFYFLPDVGGTGLRMVSPADNVRLPDKP